MLISKLNNFLTVWDRHTNVMYHH